ncbi:hypothetical protein JCM3774_004461, partial [Rhodotorula dairenensis]
MSAPELNGSQQPATSSTEPIEAREGGCAPGHRFAEEVNDTQRNTATTHHDDAAMDPDVHTEIPETSVEPLTEGTPCAEASEIAATVDGTTESGLQTPPNATGEAAPSGLDTSDEPRAPVTQHQSSSPPPRRRRPPVSHRPVPPKGILRPPSSSHAATARFSFRRDILQPFNSSYYSRAGFLAADPAATAAVASPPGGGGAGATAVPPSTASSPLVSDRGAAAAAAVGEAVGNAAATAGGFFGNALKRLGAAAIVAHAPASPQPPPPALNAPAPGAVTLPSVPSTQVNGPATPAASAASTSSSSTLVPPPSAHAAPPAAPTAPPAPTHPLPVSSLKLVRFRMSSLKVVYPINNGALEPIAPADEAATRDRVEEEWRREMGQQASDLPAAAAAAAPTAAGEKGKRRDESKAGEDEGKARRAYTGDELARVYAEACRTREEPGIERLKRLLR